jgi:starch synthase
LYGYFDDAERFAWFSRAVLEMRPALDFQPDVLHCHDWHASLAWSICAVSIGLRLVYQGIKTLFTIHNLRYQGVFWS